MSTFSDQYRVFGLVEAIIKRQVFKEEKIKFNSDPFSKDQRINSQIPTPLPGNKWLFKESRKITVLCLRVLYFICYDRV